jgi:hypothetical protein
VPVISMRKAQRSSDRDGRHKAGHDGKVSARRPSPLEEKRMAFLKRLRSIRFHKPSG